MGLVNIEDVSEIIGHVGVEARHNGLNCEGTVKLKYSWKYCTFKCKERDVMKA